MNRMEKLESRVLFSVAHPPAPIVGLVPPPGFVPGALEIDFQLPKQTVGTLTRVDIQIHNVLKPSGSVNDYILSASLPAFKQGTFYAAEERLAPNTLYSVTMTMTVKSSKHGLLTSPFSVAKTFRTHA